VRAGHRQTLVKRFNANFQNAGDLILLARVLGAVCLARLALLFMTPTAVVARFDKARPSTRPLPIEKAVKFTDFATGYKRGADGGCLFRSLALFRLFRQAGLPVAINFGLSRQLTPARGLKGHGWVNLSGNPVMESGNPTEKYVTMYSYLAGSGMINDWPATD